MRMALDTALSYYWITIVTDKCVVTTIPFIYKAGFLKT